LDNYFFVLFAFSGNNVLNPDLMYDSFVWGSYNNADHYYNIWSIYGYDTADSIYYSYGDKLSALFYVDKFEDFAVVENAVSFKTQVENNGAFSGKNNHVEFELKKDKFFELLSVRDASFGATVDSVGLWNAILLEIGFKEFNENVIESISDISAFVVLDSRINPDTNNSYLYDAIHLDKSTFLSTYLVAESNYDEIISKMQYALDNKESFVLIRYDVYDYYCDYASDELFTIRDDLQMFGTRYYDGFQLTEMELKNIYNYKVYQIEMTPISIIHDITLEDNIDDETIIKKLESRFELTEEKAKEYLKQCKETEN